MCSVVDSLFPDDGMMKNIKIKKIRKPYVNGKTFQD